MKMKFSLAVWISIFLYLQLDEASCQLPQIAVPVGKTTIVCPNGWILFQSSNTCMLFSAEKASWIGAASWCKTMGGRLAEISSVPIKTELQMKMMMFGHMIKPGKYWIGLSDIENEGLFKWMQSGKPSIFRGKSNDRYKNCVYKEQTGMWYVDACTAQLPFICERVK